MWLCACVVACLVGWLPGCVFGWLSECLIVGVFVCVWL